MKINFAPIFSGCIAALFVSTIINYLELDYRLSKLEKRVIALEIKENIK